VKQGHLSVFQFLSPKRGKSDPNVPELGSIGGRCSFCRGFLGDLAKFKPEKPVEIGKCFQVDMLLKNLFNLADASP
jgi:hypothetical protein